MKSQRLGLISANTRSFYHGQLFPVVTAVSQPSYQRGFRHRVAGLSGLRRFLQLHCRQRLVLGWRWRQSRANYSPFATRLTSASDRKADSSRRPPRHLFRARIAGRLHPADDAALAPRKENGGPWRSRHSCLRQTDQSISRARAPVPVGVSGVAEAGSCRSPGSPIHRRKSALLELPAAEAGPLVGAGGGERGGCHHR